MDHATLFSSAGFMPHGHCYLWTPSLLALQVGTNLAIGLAYVAISATLATLVHRIRDLPFRMLYVAFGVFIVTCGFTHLMDVWVIWRPDYWADGAVRAVTAAASVGTAILLPPLVPQAVALARAAQAAHERGIRLNAAVQDLEALYQRSTEVDRLKTAFFANVSHELRTPLALVLGPLERLAGADLPDAVRADVEVVRRNAHLLLGQVEDLLDLARLEAGQAKLRLARADLAELVRATAASFDALAADRQTTVIVETPAALAAAVDVDRVQRIVLNLLSNALKFTPPGGRVRVALVPRGDDAEILVEDSGPGIPEDMREAVFERFRQLGDGERGGTGIGLAITREFAHMHGGDVSLDASADGGARFRVRLPLRRGTEAPEAPSRASEGAVARATAGLSAHDPEPAPSLPADPRHPVALVVEDHPDMRRFVGRVLEEARYRVLTARDGVEGVERAKEVIPDVIVSDLAMPGGATGEALVAAVRADPALDHTPIVLLTARADDALRVHLLSHGAQDWIQKPFVAEELRVRVDNLVQVNRLRRFLQQQLESKATDVDVLVRELDATRKLAERSSQVKSTFLRAVSHELRAPLHALGLALDLVVRRPQDRDLVLQQAHQSLARMRSLVEALLERARLEGAEMRLSLSTFALGDLAREVAEGHRARAAEKGLALAVHGDAAITSDRQLVHVVLDNLVRNAVDATRAGQVEVLVEPGARVVVRDSGPGLAGIDVDRMFEPFGQARGLGIGLSLVRDLCEALGGEVSGRSEATGAVFTVVLPSLDSDRIH